MGGAIAVKGLITGIILLTMTFGSLFTNGFLIGKITAQELNEIKNERFLKEKDRIEEDIEEILDDYGLFEEQYAEKWVEWNEDWIREKEKLTEEDLRDMRDSSIRDYVNEGYCDKNYIDDATWGYMKKQIGEEAMNFLRKRVRNGNGFLDNEVLKKYLEKTLNGGEN